MKQKRIMTEEKILEIFSRHKKTSQRRIVIHEHDFASVISEILELAKLKPKAIETENDAIKALKLLVEVKDWKDKYGKDKHYLKQRDIAWREANNVIDQYVIDQAKLKPKAVEPVGELCVKCNEPMKRSVAQWVCINQLCSGSVKHDYC